MQYLKIIDRFPGVVCVCVCLWCSHARLSFHLVFKPFVGEENDTVIERTVFILEKRSLFLSQCMFD